jgi:hypothetical protein
MIMWNYYTNLSCISITVNNLLHILSVRAVERILRFNIAVNQLRLMSLGS